jgi:quinol monooxygenase YgiN
MSKLLALGDLHTQIPHRDAVERIMLDAQTAAREREGCESFSFAQVVGDPGHYLTVARWRDRAAMEGHYGSPAFAAYQAAIAPLLVADSELELHVVEQTVRPVDSGTLDLRQDD